jgi:plasmid maintenance system antidote protein VapI
MRNETTGTQFQQELFKKIKSRLTANTQLSHEIAERLHLSEATAYRRINGEAPLSVEELVQLVQHYQLSVDDLLNIHSNQFLFSGHLMDSSGNSFLNYLSNLGNTLQLVSENNGQLTCFNKDIPIFYQFFFPELAWFKFFFWQKHILLVPELQHRKFSLTDCPKDLLDEGYRIYYNYQRLDSTELWNIESIHTTLRQMVYSRQVREYMNPGDIDVLLKQLRLVIETIKLQAEKGEKISFGKKWR